MRRPIATIAVCAVFFLLAFALTGCEITFVQGSSTERAPAEESSEMTSDELLAQAIEIDLDALVLDCNDNAAKFELDWDGKVVKTTGIIGYIGDDNVGLTPAGANIFTDETVAVYLPMEEIATLSREEQAGVVGIMDVDNGSFSIDDAHVVDPE